MSTSKRYKILESNPSPIMEGHGVCASDPFTESNNEGYLNYGTAENHIMYDYLLPKINEPVTVDATYLPYNPLHGRPEVKQTVANFFEKYLNLKDVNPENIVIQTGVSAICESMSFAMFDSEDIIMMPTPYYIGFDHDFLKRFNCKFLRVPLDKTQGFPHDIKAFKTAYKNSPAKNKIKAVLICHPHNPTGEVISESFFKDITDFCLENDIELISDEIYALSNRSGDTHSSLYQYAVDKKVKAHFLYGMAKDFGLAGFKIGFYYSNNQVVAQALQNLCYFHPVSSHTQAILNNLLRDQTFLDKYIPCFQKRLLDIQARITSELSEFKFLKSQAGIFNLLDLTEYCSSFESELVIFQTLLSEYKINMTPGQDLGLETPGYFRVCFAHDKATTNEFIRRMHKVHNSLKQQ